MLKFNVWVKPEFQSKFNSSAQSQLICEPLEPRRMLATVDVYAAGSTGEETMEVRLFDRVLATFENVGGDADAGVFEKYSFEVDFESGEVGDMDDLFIAFTNDLFIPGEVDRNLRVDAIVLSEFEGSTGDLDRREAEGSTVYSTGTWTEDGLVRGYRESEFLHSNGFFNFSGEREGGTSIRIEAKGNEGGEQFDLQVDGETVETFTVTQNTQSFFWQAPSDQRVDYDQVRIAFTNDQYDPANGIDGNLIVQDVQVGRFANRDFAIQPSRSRTVFSTGSWRPEDGISPGIRYSDTLHINGYFQFGVFDVPSAGYFSSGFPAEAEDQRSEDFGAYEITISRSGSFDGEVSIVYTTRFGSADASDFNPVSGTAILPDGVSSTDITIPIIDDSQVESTESFDFVLSNPGGGAVLNTSGVTTLQILDNDSSGEGGVIFEEVFESAGNAGWTFDPFGTDTASRGRWEIGFPEETASGDLVFQLGSGFGSSRALVTGLDAGTGIGTFDVDGGVTSALSPEINLPNSNAQLTVNYNFAHTKSVTADDQLRIAILVDGQVVNVLQDNGNRGATRTSQWLEATISLDDFSGQTIQLLFEAEDSSNTIVEAAIGRVVVETVG